LVESADHWFEGKELSEIAVMLGLTVEQVRARHHRAMVKLREILGWES
jgi:DNA-directed RNA polymerase specialized sigma24 family protein